MVAVVRGNCEGSDINEEYPSFEDVWIHLGILRTRGGELAASRYLYCSALAAYDDVGPTLLGALAGEAVLSESQGQRPGLQYLQCATVALQF